MPPAARITDVHTCPAHGGGPVVTGFATVIIGYQPAARVSDEAICPGPLDSIASGSATVIIGHQQAARMGDPTAHGGVVATGFPTVIIGTTAQAATLSGASGVPFCAECERARREAEARAEEQARTDKMLEEAGGNAQPAAEEPASADEPTEDERAQASAPGDTLEQRAAREKVARDFYATSGLGSARADVDLGVGGVPPRPNRHPKGFGIDLSKPVSVVELPATLAQVVPKGALPGNVFDLAAHPRALGLVTFAMPAGSGLLSTSGPGAGRTPGVPQITVPDTILRFLR